MPNDDGAPQPGAPANRRTVSRLVPVHPFRQLLGALFLPGLASLVGRVFLRSLISDTFRRYILVGCLVVLAKDVVAILFEYGKLRQRIGRHIQSFVP